MPAYTFEALDSAGRPQSGVLQADTARAARSSIRERGLTPLRVDALADEAGVARSGRLRGAELAPLTRQLATLVASGLPIDESLQALGEEAEGRVREQVLALRSRVMEGQSLAAAMAEAGTSFPPMFRASIGAGESAGKLDLVLLRLADHVEARDATRRRVLLALTYPSLLALVAIAVVCGLMLWVVPQVIQVFAQHQQTLPWPTRALIALSDAVRGGGLVLAGLVGASVVAFAIAYRRPRFRGGVQSFLLRTPVLGKLIRATEVARFARTLALLVGSAVPLLEALAIATQVLGIEPLRRALAVVGMRVREGQALSRAMAESGAFPPIAVRLVASGERSGRLDVMLAEAAQHQERETDTALAVAMTILGPGVILLVGGLVLFIVLAILLPIFELNSLVR